MFFDVLFSHCTFSFKKIVFYRLLKIKILYNTSIKYKINYYIVCNYCCCTVVVAAAAVYISANAKFT